MKAQHYTLPADKDMAPGQWVFPNDESHEVSGFVHRVEDGRAHIVLFETQDMGPSVEAAGGVMVKEVLTEDELADFITRTDYLCPGFLHSLMTN